MAKECIICGDESEGFLRMVGITNPDKPKCGNIQEWGPICTSCCHGMRGKIRGAINSMIEAERVWTK